MTGKEIQNQLSVLALKKEKLRLKIVEFDEQADELRKKCPHKRESQASCYCQWCGHNIDYAW